MGKPSNVVQSVFFAADGFYDLTWSHRKESQIESVISLAEFCNNYVLNDVTILHTDYARWDAFESFLRVEITDAGSIRSAGQNPFNSPDWIDLSALEATAGVTEKMESVQNVRAQLQDILRIEGYLDDDRSIRELVEEGILPDHYRGPRSLEQAREQRINLRKGEHDAHRAAIETQMVTYILLADAMEANYVPEVRYGFSALKNYPKFIRGLAQRTPTHEYFYQVVNELTIEKTGKIANIEEKIAARPSFLLEALRQASDADGLWYCLREIRESEPLRLYRELNRAVLFGKPAERREASIEMEGAIDVRFGKSGLNSRIDERVVWLAGMSAAGLALLFPGFRELVLLAPFVGPAFEAADIIDRSIRRRRNPFTSFGREQANLFSELNAKFDIRFDNAELTAALSKRESDKDELFKLPASP